MAVHHRLGRRQTGATDTNSEWMGGATTTLASTDQCLLGGASLRTRGGGGGGGGLGGRINVEDKPCVWICLFRPSIVINATYRDGVQKYHYTVYLETTSCYYIDYFHPV